MGNFHQIGEVCHITGLTARTLHYYDEIGLLVPSERLAGGQRLYTAADLDRIQRIKELKRLLGLSLSEIQRLLDAEDQRERHLAAAAQATDERARRAALEQALGVTEAQWRSVQEKITQLSQFRRKLERQVRDVRRLLGARARRAAAKITITPSTAAVHAEGLSSGNGFGPSHSGRAKSQKGRDAREPAAAARAKDTGPSSAARRAKVETKAPRVGAAAGAAGGDR